MGDGDEVIDLETYYGVDVTIPIFSYGILRKKSWLQSVLDTYHLEGVKVTPAKIKDFVAYNSNGINMVFSVTQKQKDKNPKADWIVEGSLLTFYGRKDRIAELYRHIDQIEYGYYKEVVKTVKGTDAYVYLISPRVRQLDLIKIYGMGIVIYPDSILTDAFVSKNNVYDDVVEPAKDGETTVIPANKKVYMVRPNYDVYNDDAGDDNSCSIYTYEGGRVTPQQIRELRKKNDIPDYIG